MGRLLRGQFALLLLLATAAAADPVRQVSLPANDLAYDPVTGKIYASVPSTAGARGNSVTAIDPATGQMGASVFIGSEPGKLAVADQGGTIYASLDGAAAVRRFDTSTGAAGLQFSLGSGYGPNYTDDLAVVPGHPERVAISLYNKGISPNGVGVFIFENGAPLPQFVKGVNSLAYSDRPDRLYGYDNQSTGFGFLQMNADDTGIPGGRWLLLMTGFGVRIQFEGGRVYDSGGGVWDPESGKLLGHLPGGVIRPDSKLNRVFILQGDGANVQLLAYDATTFLKLWSAKIAGVNGGVGSLIRWGADGLAFRSSGGQIFLLHTGELNAPAPPPQPAAEAPVFNAVSGHWYQVVRVPGGIDWPSARAAAQAASYAGVTGHLATLTSVDEVKFISARVVNNAGGDEHFWLGAYQDHTAPDYREPAGGWRWVTGEPFVYANWNPGEPNNTDGDEDVVELARVIGDRWNDLPAWAALGGYLVEYEPPAAPPTPPAPAGVSQLILFPNPTPGGMLALGEVLLAQPAGAGGAVISLSSSSPAAAVVPASLAVPAGASTVTFPIATFPVAAPTVVTITAGGASGPLTAVLQVLPLSSPPPAAPNLLVNGSFEAPALPAGLANETIRGAGDLPGWRLLGGTVDVVNGLASGGWQPAPDGGGQSLDLVGNPGAGTIEQTFATDPGRTYLFSGWISHAWGIREGRANVFLNGSFFAQLLHSNDLYGTVNPADLRWQPFALPFRATSAATTLTLSDVTGLSPIGGVVLDGLSVTPTGDTGTVPVAGLAPPASLNVSMGHEAKVHLTWADSSGGQAGFELWRKIGGGDWARLAALPPNTTVYTDAGVRPSTLYTYRVRATNSQGVSPWSTETGLTTPAAPTAPTGLTSPDPGRLQVFLTWNSTPVNATAIELYRRDPGANWKLIAVLAPNVVGTTDRTALPGTTYTYRVRAANDYFASAWSNEFSYTTPAGL
jgi:hypothetical protein